MRASLPILSTTALSALLLSGVAASASTITVSLPNSSAVSTATDGETVVVQSGAGIGPLNGVALSLSGNNQTVENNGLIQSDDDEALNVTGAGVFIDNLGTIAAPDDRAIHLQNDADDATIFNGAGAKITSKDQAIRGDNGDNIENLTVENFGTIESTEGRAIQSRGPGTSVLNFGTITGGEEVIEARIDFTLENRGTIIIKDGVADEDGVQFSSGRVDNYGLIQGSDDGIDVDEGTIVNHLGGVIRVVPAPGEPGGNGIDADEETQDPINGDRPASVLAITNAGLIEGPRAIGVDAARTAAINIVNSGTLRGTSGVAVEFAPAMDASSFEIFGNSEIFGDVLLTDSDDSLTIGALTSGQLTDSFFDGLGGDDTVFLTNYTLSDILSFALTGTDAQLTLATLGGEVSGEFRNFEFWSVGGTSYTTTALASAVAPVPVPASLPLLMAGLGGLWALRRRKQ